MSTQRQISHVVEFHGLIKFPIQINIQSHAAYCFHNFFQYDKVHTTVQVGFAAKVGFCNHVHGCFVKAVMHIKTIRHLHGEFGRWNT